MELTPSEAKEVIAREFDQNINTHPSPKLKRTTCDCRCRTKTLKRIADGIEKNTHLTRSDTPWIPQAMDYRVKITEQGVEIIFKPARSVEPKVVLPTTFEEMLY